MFRVERGLPVCLLFVLGVVSTQVRAQGIFLSDPAPLNINALSDWGEDQAPEVAGDGFGNWVAVWYSRDTIDDTIDGDDDILVARSSDNGITWTLPEALNSTAATDGNIGDYYPQIATDGLGNWLVVWSSGEGLAGVSGEDNDLMVSRSTDNGVTWTSPVAINQDPINDTVNDHSAALATDRSGAWIVVWAVGENQSASIAGDYDIFVSRSLDVGATWSAPEMLNTNSTPSGTYLRTNAEPDIATDELGRWIIVWQQHQSPGNDVATVFVRSTDDGATWTLPIEINETADNDTQREESPDIASDGDGRWIVVWMFDGGGDAETGPDNDIYFSRSDDDGNTWSVGEPLNTNAFNDDDLYDYKPRISVDGSGTWITVWESALDDYEIMYARSSNHGALWTAPQPLNRNWLSEDIDDVNPAVANDGSGNWIAVWETTEGIGPLSDAGDAFYTRWSISDSEDDGCFIATAAYGTPLARELNRFRAVRDTRLLTTAIGAAFVDTYYRVSPPIADYIAVRPIARGAVRGVLQLGLGAPAFTCMFFIGTCVLMAMRFFSTAR